MKGSPIAAILAVLAMITLSSAGYTGHYGSYDYYSVPKYAYNYGVQDKITGDYKHAHEERDGSITRGSYTVLQPDGVLRTVKYVVDPNGGFQAKVINSGGKDAHVKSYGYESGMAEY